MTVSQKEREHDADRFIVLLLQRRKEKIIKNYKRSMSQCACLQLNKGKFNVKYFADNFRCLFIVKIYSRFFFSFIVKISIHIESKIEFCE